MVIFQLNSEHKVVFGDFTLSQKTKRTFFPFSRIISYRFGAENNNELEIGNCNYLVIFLSLHLFEDGFVYCCRERLKRVRLLVEQGADKEKVLQ